jgi:hypothetical protein
LQELGYNPEKILNPLRDKGLIYVLFGDVYLIQPSLLYQFRTLTKDGVTVREMAVFGPYCVGVGM